MLRRFLVFAVCAMVFLPGVKAREDESQDSPGQVRLILPKIILATPGIEANVYFENVVLTLAPAADFYDLT